MSDEHAVQDGGGLPQGLMDIDRKGGFGSTALSRHPDIAFRAEEERQKDLLVTDVFDAARERILKDVDLSPSGRARRLAAAMEEALGTLDRREAEVVDHASRHEHQWTTATDLQRLAKVPESGPGWFSPDDVAYGRHVALEALRRAKMQGDHAVEALLLRAARSGDRVTVGAAFYLPPVVREEIIPNSLLPRVAEELHAALHPEEHQRLQALADYWAYRRSIVNTYRTYILKSSNIHAGG